jgi:hypothetical protein
MLGRLVRLETCLLVPRPQFEKRSRRVLIDRTVERGLLKVRFAPDR